MSTPGGIEESANSSGSKRMRPAGGNAGGNIPSELAELMQLWANMPTDAQEACLAIAWGSNQCSALSECLLRPIPEIDRSCGILLLEKPNALDSTDIDTYRIRSGLRHRKEDHFRSVGYVLSR